MKFCVSKSIWESLTVVHLVLNQFEKCNYNSNLVWTNSNQIQDRILHVCVCVSSPSFICDVSSSRRDRLCQIATWSVAILSSRHWSVITNCNFSVTPNCNVFGWFLYSGDKTRHSYWKLTSNFNRLSIVFLYENMDDIQAENLCWLIMDKTWSKKLIVI